MYTLVNVRIGQWETKAYFHFQVDFQDIVLNPWAVGMYLTEELGRLGVDGRLIDGLARRTHTLIVKEKM